MKIKLLRTSLAALVCLCGATILAATASAADAGAYTSNDAEYYLTADQLLFIRPGLVAEITDVTLPADMKLEVTFSITDPGGLPLDNTGVMTPGPVDFRFTLANYPASGEQKVRLAYERDSRNGTLTPLDNGVYMYKFDYVMDSDQDTTHTLVLGFRRDLREFDLDRYAANDIQNWVPSGMSDPAPRDVVTTETCNRCHDPLTMHGSRWLSVEACGQCHNPTFTEERESTRSMDDMIHALHMGPRLETPLVVGSHDYSLMTFPTDMKECELCHTGGTPTKNMPLVASPNPVQVCDMSGRGSTSIGWGGGLDPFELYYESPEGASILFTRRGGVSEGSVEVDGWLRNGAKFYLTDIDSGDTIQKIAVNTTVLGCVGNAPGTPRGLAGTQHTNWLTNPSRRTCGSCHDDVNFETGEGHSMQDDDSMCGTCHQPDSGKEFDRSVKGAHQIVYKSAQLPGVLLNFLGVADTDPGDNPTVSFSIGTKQGSLNPANLDRLRFTITGPNEDYDVYIRETVGNMAIEQDGIWHYTFETPLPLDAAGSFTVSVEGRNEVDVDMGSETSSERDVIESSRLAFAVTDDVAKSRRMIVDDEKCENCHSNLNGHGGGRTNTQYCATCHTPSLVDIAPVPESVNHKWMIHKIHRGENLENGYVVIRSRGTFDFSHIKFPGDLRNCETCHVNGSEQLPLSTPGLLPQITPNFWWDPIEPAASACLGCHDSDDAAVHAYTNTSVFGEACATCHGEGKEVSVDKVHAR